MSILSVLLLPSEDDISLSVSKTIGTFTVQIYYYFDQVNRAVLFAVDVTFFSIFIHKSYNYSQ